MKTIYKKAEFIFETFAKLALKAFGSSIAFILAVLVVIVFLAATPFSRQSLHDSIYNVILCFTFLGFFIIQKSFNKFNAVLNLKINELVSAHDKASNRLVNIEDKSETELIELTKHYSDIAEESKKSGELHTAQSIEHRLGSQKADPTINKEK
jgi:low affinity Fe/Cu permease